MAFRFSGQTLNNALVADISCMLDQVAVPGVLWGNYLLTVIGVPTIVEVRLPALVSDRSPTPHIQRVRASRSSCQIISSRPQPRPSTPQAFPPAAILPIAPW
ncbi:MAG: hypothetical protein M1832_001551 [Thelocarpon impressellum]|nr:MAG: hypothetical protein M1832_001551 [Thelocarpon impressellum]